MKQADRNELSEFIQEKETETAAGVYCGDCTRVSMRNVESEAL
jgi:hypothetical protein